MRTLFLVLLLANVAFFAWTRLVAQGGAGADPGPLARQISPEKLRVVRPAPPATMQSGAGATSRNTRYMRSTAPACAWRQPVSIASSVLRGVSR